MKKKRKKKTLNEIFLLTEKGMREVEILRTANLKDDTLSLKAHGLWATIWFEAQNPNQKITLETLCKNTTETPQSMQKALKELMERGHISVDENQIITLK